MTMKRILILGACLGVLTGCADRLPTDVDRAPVEPAAHLGAVGSASDTDPLGGIDDALDRIIPALSDPLAARPLTAALSGLRTALANADKQGVPALIDAAYRDVDRYARTGADAADVDVIRLALDYARQALLAES
jgi:hypothetical protein